jgi:arylsulfatase A-like enzyme
MRVPAVSGVIAVAAAAALAVPAIGAAAGDPRDPPPNVVLILADDLGYGDVGAYGAAKPRTPNIDRIAREGMRFTDAHSPASVCTPVRYAVLSGREYWRARTWAQGEWDGRLLLGPEHPNLPRLLGSSGYRTACVGKWHLGFGDGAVDWNGRIEPGPVEAGCDYFFGLLVSNNIPPYVFVENHHVVGLDPADPLVVKPSTPGKNDQTASGGKSAQFRQQDVATELTRRAVAFIGENAARPFFLYFPITNVHGPVRPHPRFRGTSGCGAYCDAIHELDWAVGEILGALDERGLAERTIVIFTSDNGPVLYRDVLAAGHVSSGDLLGQKTDVWEGGHRVPFLARWPGRIPSGAVSDELVALTDLFATILGLLERPMPAGAAPDSLNLAPVLLGHAGARSPRLDFMMKGTHGVALRHGPWWFYPAQGSGGATTQNTGDWWLHLPDLGRATNDYDAAGVLLPDAPPGQLFDIESDPQQRTNLYGARPDIVEEMLIRYEAMPAPMQSPPRARRALGLEAER